MKKIVAVFLGMAIIIVCYVGLSARNETEFTVSAIEESGICSIRIQPKIELLGVVQYLADDNVIKHDNSQYSLAIKKYFSDFKEERVIDLYKNMRNNGFSYHIPPKFMLYVNNNLELKEDISLPDDVINRAGGEENLKEFLNLLKNFKEKSQFDKFYEQQNEYYKNIVSNVKNKINKTDSLNKIIEYYGYNQNSFNIIIQPLSIGGYGVRVLAEDDKWDVYDFMVVPNNDREFTRVLLHEFGHSYVNPLTEKNIDEVNKYSSLFEIISESMGKQAYSRWESCVNEHIVRAVTSRILNNIYGETVSESFIDYHRQRNFIYIDKLYEKLDEYENNREKYKTFKDFYPQLLDVLKELCEEK